MIRWYLVLLPLCGAWIIPPHVENAPLEEIGKNCDNHTFENWLLLQPEPHLFNEDGIQLLEEAKEVLDYVEPEDDPDFVPGSIDLSEYEDEDEVERFKRSIEDEELYADDLADDGGVDVPIEGGVDGEVDAGNETSHGQPIAFLKVKQRGRTPDVEMLQPSEMAHVLLKNYQKAPMSFIITFSPFDDEDEESTQAFYEETDPIKDVEFYKMSPCWLNHTLAQSGKCKKPKGRHHHHHEHQGHNRTGHDRHEHGHDGHHHGPGHHGQKPHHALGPHHDHKHDEHEDAHNEVNHTDATPSNEEEHPDYGEGMIDLRGVNLEDSSDVTGGSEGEESGRKICNCKKCRQRKLNHKKAEGKATVCPQAIQGWVEGESKVFAEYVTPKQGCFVVRAYVSFPLDEGTLVMTSEANVEILEHFDCIKPNPVPPHHINDYDEEDSSEELDSEYHNEKSAEDSDESSEESDEEDNEVDMGYRHLPRGRHHRSLKHREFMERIFALKNQRMQFKNRRNKRGRHQRRLFRRRNRMNGAGANVAGAKPDLTGNRFLVRNQTTPGAKICCREGINHKKSSTYQNEDETYPSLECGLVPPEVSLWAAHKFGIQTESCQMKYTDCCDRFDLETWKMWVARREAKKAKRQKKKQNRMSRNNVE